MTKEHIEDIVYTYNALVARILYFKRQGIPYTEYYKSMKLYLDL
jgi:hypothetical protein